MKNRVVITGLGVVSPNGIGKSDFKEAIKKGVSGIKYLPELDELKFESKIGGIPPVKEGMAEEYFTALELMRFNSNGILYGVIAGMDAWRDAGLTIPDSNSEPDWETGGI